MAKRRGRLLRAALAIIVGLATVSAFGYYFWNRHYQKLLSVGSEIDSFLATYSKDVKSMSQSLVLSSYGDGARVDFFSRLDAPQEIDGAKKIAYLAEPAEARSPLPEQ